MKDLPKRCIQWYASRQQRIAELRRGDGVAGTKNFEDAGCYDGCDGRDISKPCYYIMREERG